MDSFVFQKVSLSLKIDISNLLRRLCFHIHLSNTHSDNLTAVKTLSVPQIAS